MRIRCIAYPTSLQSGRTRYGHACRPPKRIAARSHRRNLRDTERGSFRQWRMQKQEAVCQMFGRLIQACRLRFRRSIHVMHISPTHCTSTRELHLRKFKVFRFTAPYIAHALLASAGSFSSETLMCAHMSHDFASFGSFAMCGYLHT